MIQFNPKVDLYLLEGCGRCKYHATPKCKVNLWRNELELLRQIALDSGLIEEIKWGIPVYTFNNKNIVSVSAFKNDACISFFKGSLINDPYHLLTQSSENSQSFRLIKYTDSQQIELQKEAIHVLILQAIDIEKQGKKIDYRSNTEPMPEELLIRFNENPVLKKAFEALTPGRQRGYILYFSQAKQANTRYQRIDNYTNKILEGKGYNDDYKAKNPNK
jgi:uncharacterized protein YdeI (YjbR/CyaY-like superfamily)